MAHVLIVEDDADTRRLLERRLARAGHAVESAPTGEHALECLAAASFDLLVLDVELPGIDGVEVARRARARTADVPVVACTIADPDDLPADFAPDGWVTKPFASSDLVAAVEAALDR